jgi:hypothetical protein
VCKTHPPPPPNTLTSTPTHTNTSLLSELLGFWTLSIIQNSKYWKTQPFWKLDLFLSSGEGRETSTLLGPSERPNLNHWTNSVQWTKSKNPVILSVIHYPQNPSDFTSLLCSVKLPVCQSALMCLPLRAQYRSQTA